MSGTVLEDMVAEAFEKRGYIVFTRRNHCDVLARASQTTLFFMLSTQESLKIHTESL